MPTVIDAYCCNRCLLHIKRDLCYVKETYTHTCKPAQSQGWLKQFGIIESIDDAPLQGSGSATIPFLEGEHARMLCNAGYLAMGSGSITPVCQADGNFSGSNSEK
jgi:hypothetical protein